MLPLTDAISQNGHPIAPHRNRADETPITMTIVGADPTSTNLGVAALGTATAKACLDSFPTARLIFQSWSPHPTINLQLADRQIQVESLELYHSYSPRQRHGTAHLRLLRTCTSVLPAPLKRWMIAHNRTFDLLRQSDLVLDITGGDSFTDIYGPNRHNIQAARKLLVLNMGIPMVLLPQTVGPFTRESSRTTARQIIDRSLLCATREFYGLDELDELFGGHRPDHMVQCPDVAFALDPVPVPLRQEPFLEKRHRNETLIGLNVSGLLYWCDPQRFDVQLDYPRLIDNIADWALSKPDTRLVLIPHVIAPASASDDPSTWGRQKDMHDTGVCMMVRKQLSKRYGDRVGSIGGPYTAGQTKYLVGQCDFFLGARMHACIGAISQTIPTCTMAYSKKAAGVMGHLGSASGVIDLRGQNAASCMDAIDEVYRRRDSVRTELKHKIKDVRRKIDDFFTQPFRRVVEQVAADRHRGRIQKVPSDR